MICISYNMIDTYYMVSEKKYLGCIFFVIILNIYLQSNNLNNSNHKDQIRQTLNTFINLNVLLQKWRVTILWVLSKQMRQHIKMIYCLTFSSQRKHDAVLCFVLIILGINTSSRLKMFCFATYPELE